MGRNRGTVLLAARAGSRSIHIELGGLKGRSGRLEGTGKGDGDKPDYEKSEFSEQLERPICRPGRKLWSEP